MATVPTKIDKITLSLKNQAKKITTENIKTKAQDIYSDYEEYTKNVIGEIKEIDFFKNLKEESNSYEDTKATVDSGFSIFDDIDDSSNPSNDIENNENKPSGSISYKEGTNYEIDTSTPVTKGTKYNLTEEEKKKLAYIAWREQRSVEGAKIELSLMANLYESRGDNYSSIYSYVGKSGWFGKNAYANYSEPPQEYIDAVNDVLEDGNRYLPTNCVEHDCTSDIVSVKVNGKAIDPNDRSAYVPYETVIENRYGAKYTFVGFAPTTEWGVKGDPFGYL